MKWLVVMLLLCGACARSETDVCVDNKLRKLTGYGMAKVKPETLQIIMDFCRAEYQQEKEYQR